MPKKDTGTQTSPVLGLGKWFEQQIKYRGGYLTRCRRMRKQVLDELTQELHVRHARSSETLERRTS